LLGQGGKAAREAGERTARDHSRAVAQVRQQILFTPRREKASAKPAPLPPPPKDVKEACAKMLEELPGLEKRSAWEEMTRRAETLAAWSRRGHDPATDALFELTETKVQRFWYPGIVQQNLAASGTDRAWARIKEFMPRAHHAFIVRGLEETA